MISYPHAVLAARKEVAMKKKRILKVYEFPGPGPRVPQIRLSGKWLEQLGYNIGDHIAVSCKGDRLTIQLVAPASAAKA